MEKIRITKNVDFYISHACNMNCPNCNSLNNYNFRGNFLWKDYEDVYSQWTETVDLTRIAILGGEPLANPDVLNWIKGCRRLWPESILKLTTNGTLIKSTDTELYNTLIETDCILTISLHNRQNLQELIDRLCDWIPEPVVTQRIANDFEYEKKVNSHWDTIYEQLRGEDWPNHVTYQERESLPDWIQSELNEFIGDRFDNLKAKHTQTRITDKNNIDIEINVEDSFAEAPAQYNNDTKSFHFNDSDPELAHEACTFKYCHMMFKGKLYKCASSALFSDFIDQFTTTLTNKQRKIIETPTYASVDMSYDKLKETIENTMEHTIPQCTLCTQKRIFGEQFFADIGNKPKVTKNKKTVKY